MLSHLHPCNRPGCNVLTRDRFCPSCAQKRGAEDRTRRGSARDRGYDSRWERYRKVFLLEHPLCEECLRHKRTTVSVVVDHIRPHKGDRLLFWEPSNHQALCSECHNRKTYQEDGAFGRPVTHRASPARDTPRGEGGITSLGPDATGPSPKSFTSERRHTGFADPKRGGY